MTAVYLVLRCPVCGTLSPYTWRVDDGEPMWPSLCDGLPWGQKSHPPTVREVAFIERGR